MPWFTPSMNCDVKLLGGLEKASDNLQLFRYMHLSTLLLLLKRRAFFPSVANLCKCDSFEGQLFCEPAWLMTELSEIMKSDTAGRLDSWLKEQAHQWESKSIDSEDTSPSSRTDILAGIYTRDLKERRAAWCWFEDDLESAGMWSVYGHRGVAVRTNLKALKSSLHPKRAFQIERLKI